jgi:hypothetical protein
MRALSRNCGCRDVVGDRDIADGATLAWRFATYVGSSDIPALTVILGVWWRPSH